MTPATIMTNATDVYNNILYDFINNVKNYISQNITNLMADTIDNFHAFCDVYNYEHYGIDGYERFETESECLNFIGNSHVDEVLMLMSDFVNEDSYTNIVDTIEIVNTWRYDQVAILSYTDRLYNDISVIREV